MATFQAMVTTPLMAEGSTAKHSSSANGVNGDVSKSKMQGDMSTQMLSDLISRINETQGIVPYLQGEAQMPQTEGKKK